MSEQVSVLVVDDDPVIHVIASQILEPHGYQVTHANDGVEALRSLAERTFDVVVLDMLMPNKEGLETLVEIRGRWPGLKVVAISGGGRIDAHELLHWASIAGADATLPKPLSGESLLGAVKACVAADRQAS